MLCYLFFLFILVKPFSGTLFFKGAQQLQTFDSIKIENCNKNIMKTLFKEINEE